MFWEWDWNWSWFAFFCIMVFVAGIAFSVIGLPGVFCIVIAMIVGACAGSWEWFENHDGNNDY